ncbi:MAG: hypothetical protein H0W30_15815 [Gemmatimonadaceae bacterium]|nr:hypothetical protein [Gemmatimonadaceae bacterium]MDQ3517804.1 hypothetical protein [Gemmatimonadota bacterium]
MSRPEDDRARAREVLFGANERHPDLLPGYDPDEEANPATPGLAHERYLDAVLDHVGINRKIAARVIAKHANRVTATPGGEIETKLPSGGVLKGKHGLKALASVVVQEALRESRDPEEQARTRATLIASGLYNRF